MGCSAMTGRSGEVGTAGTVRRTWRVLGEGIASVFFIASLVGCSPPPPEKQGVDSYQNLMTVIGAYVKATDKNGRPPSKVADIKPFLVDFGDPDTLLTSPRDGQPYVIVWGIDINKVMERPNVPIVAYEKTGKDGKRYVSRGRMVFDVNEEDFQKMPFPAGHKPS